jgi:hypothetical protein
MFLGLGRHAGNGSIAGGLPERPGARRAPFFIKTWPEYR